MQLPQLAAMHPALSVVSIDSIIQCSLRLNEEHIRIIHACIMHATEPLLKKGLLKKSFEHF